MEGDEGPRSSIFERVVFTLLPGVALDGPDRNDLLDALVSNGGTEVALGSDGTIELDRVSHILSHDVDFAQYRQALDRGCHVVKPSWVLTSVRKSKRASERQHSPDPGQFFQDLIVTFGDVPEGDQDAIIAGVLAMGGQHSSPLSKLATHLVTNTLNHCKCVLVQQKNLQCKIVTPHWFDDCLTLGRKISEQPYLFPDPIVLRQPQGKPAPTESPHVTGATDPFPTGLLSPPKLPLSSPSEIRRHLNVLSGKRIFFSGDLEVDPHRRKSFESLVRSAGGSVTDLVEQADVCICAYRDGLDYINASRAKMEVGNLAWFYHVIALNRYSSPCSKLLHYPVPREPLKGFENFRISVSSYTGEARTYVQQLIKCCGADFTKAMKQDNTHLIAAHKHSEKVEAAQEWNINMVNHLWLEESYSMCAVQSLTNPRYTHFPPQTDLNQVVGQTAIDLAAVERLFFPKPVLSSGRQGNHATAERFSSSDQRTVLASSAVPSVTPRALQHTDPPTPIAEDVEQSDDAKQSATTKKGRGRPPKSMNNTPRTIDDEKENESPLIAGGGRASKAKALDMLQQQASDIALFQLQMKRKGGVTHGGKETDVDVQTSSPVTVSARKGKRKSDEMTFEASFENSALSYGETQDSPATSTKKIKRDINVLPPIICRMMVTGYKPWVDKPKQMEADKTSLRLLGVVLTENASEVDVLVAPKILRTRKFVSALASAPLVVDTQYLQRALKDRKLIQDPKPLQDRETEERLDFKLSQALERAKTNDCKLFHGWSVFVTQDVAGGFETYKEIIAANGGNAFVYVGRRGLSIPKRIRDVEVGDEKQNQGGQAELAIAYLVSDDAPDEQKLWKSFCELANKQGFKARVVHRDWLLNAAMSQMITWNPKWAWQEADVRV